MNVKELNSIGRERLVDQALARLSVILPDLPPCRINEKLDNSGAIPSIVAKGWPVLTGVRNERSVVQEAIATHALTLPVSEQENAECAEDAYR